MSMADRDGVIWYDGKLVPWREATTHVLTHTLHYGMGAFEGIRAYKTAKGTAVFRLKEHTQRLFNSARILGMPMPYDQGTINSAILTPLEAATQCLAQGLVDNPLINNDAFDQCVNDLLSP